MEQRYTASPEATRQMEAAQAKVRRWEAVHSEYRQRLETLSLTLHPFRIDDSAPQTSTQVESGYTCRSQLLKRWPTPLSCRIGRPP